MLCFTGVVSVSQVFSCCCPWPWPQVRKFVGLPIVAAGVVFVPTRGAVRSQVLSVCCTWTWSQARRGDLGCSRVELSIVVARALLFSGGIEVGPSLLAFCITWFWSQALGLLWQVVRFRWGTTLSRYPSYVATRSEIVPQPSPAQPTSSQ